MPAGTDGYSKTGSSAAAPSFFYGRGAGDLPTASAVMGDVMDALQHRAKRRDLGWSESAELADFAGLSMKWYLRGDFTLTGDGHVLKIQAADALGVDTLGQDLLPPGQIGEDADLPPRVQPLHVRSGILLGDASVGGGIPVLRPLFQCLAGNQIEEVVG